MGPTLLAFTELTSQRLFFRVLKFRRTQWKKAVFSIPPGAVLSIPVHICFTVWIAVGQKGIDYVQFINFTLPQNILTACGRCLSRLCAMVILSLFWICIFVQAKTYLKKSPFANGNRSLSFWVLPLGSHQWDLLSVFSAVSPVSRIESAVLDSAKVVALCTLAAEGSDKVLLVPRNINIGSCVTFQVLLQQRLSHCALWVFRKWSNCALISRTSQQILGDKNVDRRFCSIFLHLCKILSI